MTLTQRRTYTRTTIHCDNCGFEENVVNLDEEPPDSVHQLPVVKGWIIVPVHSFAKADQHACSRRCAEILAAKAISEANPRCDCVYSRGTFQGRCVECGRPT
ncbi:MAG TPA: hypothetical protein VI341_13855 [Actinomycetota bacterium]